MNGTVMNRMHRCSRTIQRSLMHQARVVVVGQTRRPLSSSIIPSSSSLPFQLNGDASSHYNRSITTPYYYGLAANNAANNRNTNSSTSIQSRIRWNSSSNGNSNSNGNNNLDNDVYYTDEQRKQDHKHCVELVQTRDMEGYLCGLLMPSSAREAYFALRAFNVEIAGIKDASQLIGGRSRGTSGNGSGIGSSSSARSSSTTNSTTNSNSVQLFDDNNNSMMEDNGMVGDSSLASRLRMQWWTDAVADIYEKGNNEQQQEQQQQSTTSKDEDVILQSFTSSRKHNPTLRSLAHAIHTHQLTHRFLRRIMEARESDLDVLQYESIRDMAQYGEDTVSNVLYLSLECVGVREEGADGVASDIGVGLGVLTALRSTGFRATQGECSIPMDLANKHDVSMDTLWSAWDVHAYINSGGSASSSGGAADVNVDGSALKSREALQNATIEMAELASFHLHRARENQHAAPKDGRMCLLPAVCGLQYLNSLKEVDYDVLHPSLVGGGGGEGDASGVERKRRLGLMFLLGRTWLTGTF